MTVITAKPVSHKASVQRLELKRERKKKKAGLNSSPNKAQLVLQLRGKYYYWIAIFEKFFFL